jgi:glycosyltransferase involved in cell wall biosynthesis
MLRGLVRRLTSLVLQPDPQLLWLPGAVRTGIRVLRETPHDAILVTAPPFSAFLVGVALSRLAKLPLVLDYRDEWSLSSAYWENRGVGPLSAQLQRRLQRRIVLEADALVATTRCSAEHLDKVRAEAGSSARVTWIYNGFDPDDFPAPAHASQQPGGPYRLAYVGTLWKLTTVAPLVAAVRLFCEQLPDLAPHLELIFAGRRTGEQQAILDSIRELPCRLVEHAYLHHHDSVKLIESADALCILLSDLPGAGRVVPAKVFECMATKRPILAICPHGELRELLADYPSASVHSPDSIEGISAYLAQAVRNHLTRTPTPTTDWDASQYGRKAQTERLAELLNSLPAAATKAGRE